MWVSSKPSFDKRMSPELDAKGIQFYTFACIANPKAVVLVLNQQLYYWLLTLVESY